MSIGKRIKELRSTARMTQVQLAKRSGVSLPAICQIERDAVKPRAESLQKLARALQASVDFILSGEPGSAPPEEVGETLSRLEQMLERLRRQTARVPFVGTLPHVLLPWTPQSVSDWKELPIGWLNDPSGYLLRVEKQDEILEAGILSGDLIGVVKDRAPEDNDVVVVRNGEGEFTITTVQFAPGAVFLKHLKRKCAPGAFQYEGVVALTIRHLPPRP
jgi:transcriptional regulator with XRE-family HTH domain